MVYIGSRWVRGAGKVNGHDYQITRTCDPKNFNFKIGDTYFLEESVIVPDWVKNLLPNKKIVSCAVNGNEAVVQVEVVLGEHKTAHTIVLNKEKGLIGSQG